jgi:hypothetical protein
MFLGRIVGSLVLCTVLLIPAAWAAHPLITDDSGTQGKGKFQLEVNGQYDYDREKIDGVTVKTTGGQMAGTLSYGVIDNLDVILGQPYLWSTVREDGVVTSDEHGFSDMTLDVKWRFFEKNGFSFAVKPGMSFPTGNDNRGLGAGKVGYHLFGIASKEFGPWALHVNLGYIWNANTGEERGDIWHASVAATYEIVKNLKLVGNTGIERSRDKTSDTDPAYLLGGVIYSVTEKFDIDFGVKTGLNKAETDLSYLAGITVRF